MNQYQQTLLSFYNVPSIIPGAGRIAVNKNSPKSPALSELTLQRAETLINWINSPISKIYSMSDITGEQGNTAGKRKRERWGRD